MFFFVRFFFSTRRGEKNRKWKKNPKCKKKNKKKKKRFFQKNQNKIKLRIEYLHSRDLAWRDLKPENLLVAADGYLKLADLG